MFWSLRRFPAVAVLVSSLTYLAVAADPNPPAPDWSKFLPAGEITAEVKKASGDEVTLKLPGPMRGKWQEVTYQFAEEGMTRWAKIGPKFNALTSKKVPLTAKELAPFKLPKGAPGYAGQKTDLKPGDFVTLQLVRPKAIKQSQLKQEDLRIKYAIIQKMLEDPVPFDGEQPKPDPKKDDKKKDEKKKDDKKKDA